MVADINRLLLGGGGGGRLLRFGRALTKRRTHARTLLCFPLAWDKYRTKFSYLFISFFACVDEP